MYGYLSQTTYARCTVPTRPEVVQSTHSSSSVITQAINAHKCSFSVRTVPAWNALSPVSVCADSVAVFHSSVDDFYLFYCFFLCFFTNIPSDLKRLSYKPLIQATHWPLCKQYKLYPVLVFNYHVRPRPTVKPLQNGHLGDRRKWPL